MLNDRVLPFFEAQGIAVSRVLTDRGTEYCGHPQSHPYELYLAMENIDHIKAKTKSPQTNGICERFNKTILTEFYQMALCKKLYHAIEELQADLNAWMREYNTVRTHQGRWCTARRRCRPSLTCCP
jgi:transposase InsO family protein